VKKKVKTVIMIVIFWMNKTNNLELRDASSMALNNVKYNDNKPFNTINNFALDFVKSLVEPHYELIRMQVMLFKNGIILYRMLEGSSRLICMDQR
jgi:hypothetical protein